MKIWIWKIDERYFLLQIVSFLNRMYNLHLFILQNEYSTRNKEKTPLVKFTLTPFWKFRSSYRRTFINLKHGRNGKKFHIHKKSLWHTNMRFFKDSLSSTYYYFLTVGNMLSKTLNNCTKHNIAFKLIETC